jgi:hypothetical protein
MNFPERPGQDRAAPMSAEMQKLAWLQQPFAAASELCRTGKRMSDKTDFCSFRHSYFLAANLK